MRDIKGGSCRDNREKGFLPDDISRGVIVVCGVWMCTNAPGVRPKSRDITEYCDWCRRQQWCRPIVRARLCKRAADGRQTSSCRPSLQKGTRPGEKGADSARGSRSLTVAAADDARRASHGGKERIPGKSRNSTVIQQTRRCHRFLRWTSATAVGLSPLIATRASARAGTRPGVSIKPKYIVYEDLRRNKKCRACIWKSRCTLV